MNSGRQEGREPPGGEPDEDLSAELARWVRPDAVSAPNFDDLRLSLDAELAKERGPSAFLRSRSTPGRVAAVALLLLLLCLITLLFRARADLAVYPMGRMLLLSGVMLLWFLASTLLSLWPLSWPTPPRAVSKIAIAFGPVALLALYSLPTAHESHPASLQGPGGAALFLRALPCLGIGLLVALGVFVLLRAFDRGGSRTNLAMACAGGISANLLLQLHCPITAPPHMLLAHLGVALIMLAAVALRERVGPPRT
jgi:hypothetical protein